VLPKPPPGFEQLKIAAGFAADFGPIHGKRDGERVWFGFRVGADHMNAYGLAHGGALATFADMQLAALMRMGRLDAKQSPTISLSLDFLAPARQGDWVEGEIVLVKRTGRLVFRKRSSPSMARRSSAPRGFSSIPRGAPRSTRRSRSRHRCPSRARRRRKVLSRSILAPASARSSAR
jgi:acyl-coenzyme A thioesterase PaaI-like protein